jgi:Ni/Co efflux regulator RcnB
MAAAPSFRFAALAATALLCASVHAADETRQKDIEARYQRERAACENAQDKAACLRDAAAAREAAKHGQLDTAQGNYGQNAFARCNALPVEERDACVRRVRGEGVTQGSVSEGGVIREYREYTLPSPAPSSGGSTPQGR